MERTVKRLSLPQIMLRCMSLLLAHRDICSRVGRRLLSGQSRQTFYPLSIGGVEYPLPVIGGSSRDKSHGSPCCCNR